MPALRFLSQALILGAIYALEGFFPVFKDRVARAPHAVRNLGLGALNVLVTQVFFAGAIVGVAEWTRKNSIGLLPALGQDGFLGGILAFILFDGWMYVWHRANHEVPFLWRFHRVHHSDLALDCTSALRFHAGEIALSHLARLLIIPLIGMTYAQLLIYEIALAPIIQFHHSNVALPGKWDDLLRRLIVSPNMHRVHHSREVFETNSNYSSVFSFWDRIGTSRRRRQDISKIEYGLPVFRDEEWQTIPGMLKIPFVKS